MAPIWSRALEPAGLPGLGTIQGLLEQPGQGDPRRGGPVRCRGPADEVDHYHCPANANT